MKVHQSGPGSPVYNMATLSSVKVKESDIMYENGDFWVARRTSTNARIAPLGSIYYQIFRAGITVSESLPYVTANLDRAVRYCDRQVAA